MRLRALPTVVFVWLLLIVTHAWAEVSVPPLGARVTDLTHTLLADQVASLERSLDNFEKNRGSQIAVLIVPTTKPETVEQYAIRVAEQWKLGRKRIDDGALLVVAIEDRTLRIEVGYGLEGVLTDATSKRIIDEIITPRFKSGDIFAGLSEGVDALMRVIGGEPLPAPKTHAPDIGGDTINTWLFPLVIAGLVSGAMLRAIFGRLVGGLGGSLVSVLLGCIVLPLIVALPIGLIVFMFIAIFGHASRTGSRGGGWSTGGGWSSGGFSSSSGSGGFSGGGGSFGGGGASGRW